MGKYMKLAATTAIFLAMAGVAPAGAAPMKEMARIEGKPNLNGIWQVMNTANWNLEPH